MFDVSLAYAKLRFADPVADADAYLAIICCGN